VKQFLVTTFFLLVAFTSHPQPIKKVKVEDIIKMMDTVTCPLVINFWASWCAPCVHEIPWLESNIANLKEQGVKLLLVNLDLPIDYKNHLANFIKKEKYTAEVVWLDERNMSRYTKQLDSSWNNTIPVTIMVNNKKGYKQFYHQQLPEAQLRLALQKLLN